MLRPFCSIPAQYLKIVSDDLLEDSKEEDTAETRSNKEYII
jgi:hypothetical protein